MKGREGTAAPDAAADDEATVAAALAARIGAGDRGAEGELVERYSRPLLFMLRRRCGEPELADDLHQDVFRVVIERLRGEGIKDPSRLAGFIQSTGRNLLIGVIRRRQRRQTYADTDSVSQAADTTSTDQVAATDTKQTNQHLRVLLGELSSDRDRAILTRFYLLQEDKASICRQLDLTDLHFNRVLYRAKKRFRELLESHDSRAARDLVDSHGGE
ncbi:MAG: sigma-70 family RNA polymerase sigma factor [Pseudomonadota bacterium]